MRPTPALAPTTAVLHLGTAVVACPAPSASAVPVLHVPDPTVGAEGVARGPRVATRREWAS